MWQVQSQPNSSSLISMSASDNTPKSNLDIRPQLADWLQQQLQLEEKPELMPLGGDAGFRCYFRLAGQPKMDGRNLIAVYAPPEVEKNHEFVAVAEKLKEISVNTPTIYAKNLDLGFFLLEDFGNEHLFDILAKDNVLGLYGRSSQLLINMQMTDNSIALPQYDESVLQREMDLLQQWFLPELLGYQLGAEESAMLANCYQLLLESAIGQTQRLVHRDFHSRNIMLANEELALIDFQDAVWGPITYDLVSLLRDCYVYWPKEIVQQALQQHWDEMPESLRTSLSFEEFVRGFDLMGLQRHIKVLGIFARLALRDEKHAYLNDLPLVIRYTVEVAENYPQFAAFADWFKAKIIPLCEQQSWYVDFRHAGEQGAHLSRAAR